MEIDVAGTTSERVKAGLDRAKAEGKRLGRQPALLSGRNLIALGASTLNVSNIERLQHFPQ